MTPKVLFLCTGNSARSQMAEGYLRSVLPAEYEAMSAGIEPKGLNRGIATDSRVHYASNNLSSGCFRAI